MIAVDLVSVGSLSASLVHPREVFKPALIASAAHVVAVHNHPSGVVVRRLYSATLEQQSMFSKPRMRLNVSRLSGLDVRECAMSASRARTSP